MTNLLSLRSSRTALVDRIREEEASALAQIVGVVGFALITALAAQVNFRLYLWEVPITLQTMAVYASGLYLGWRNGLLAQALYLLMGMFAPVYAGGGYGPEYLLGAVSAGYLLSYPLAAAAIGALSKKWKSLSGATLSMLVGYAVVFTIGVTWLHFAAGHETWLESIDRGMLRFIVIDLAKIAGLGLLYAGTRTLGSE